MLGQQLDYVNFQYTITAVAMFATLGKQKQEGIYITVNVLGQYVQQVRNAGVHCAVFIAPVRAS